ncbi:diguanylate cyclase [Pontibacillus yanchengensis]|uniref:Diguanylate cyclase n=1 Tax=Pontibacillus yanchengensis Y32 TaxID=1385514 RepID=A0A0A2TCM4_9BACI|nr:diguanylate cyclase [Pontibacillus yanchengensis]KGP73592.1 diguanylate cyclase [Pontibacillus yanchengensis Y32]
MKKYQRKFLERVRSTIQNWTNESTISNRELYHFLHSIKGTALSIGLENLTYRAEELLEGISEKANTIWTYDEWSYYIKPIINELAAIDSGLVEEEAVKEAHQEKVDPSTPLILVVEDDIDMMSFLKDHLEEHYTVLVAASVQKAVSIFYNQKPDYVIVDIYLGEETGFELLQQIVQKARKNLIPTMLISADNSMETRAKAYESGAFDFLQKPIQAPELVAIVGNRLRYKSIFTQQILIDELTGAYNRRFLQDEIERQWSDFNRTRSLFSVAMIDIDRFKSVNDTYGHDTGDVILQGLSSTIMRDKRNSDLFIRYGGEEFTLIMPDTNVEEAEVLLERLRLSFESQRYEAGQTEIACTFSAGVTTVQNQTATPEDLLKEADIALYQAKEKGRNQVRRYVRGSTVAHQSGEEVIHIGVIDDDPVIHHLLEDHLHSISIPQHHVEFQTFRDGESFFESNWHQQNGKFILLLDGIMPRMDGLEVLSRLREECAVDDFIIIMLTGRKKDQDIVKALELGADDYITKPFSVTEVEARIRRLAQRLLF